MSIRNKFLLQSTSDADEHETRGNPVMDRGMPNDGGPP